MTTSKQTTTITPLAENPELIPVQAKLAKLDAALADIRREKQSIQESSYLASRQGADDDADVALRILDGEPVDTRTVAEQIRALESKADVLARGRAKVRQAADDIIARATFEANNAMKPAHHKALLELYATLRAAGHAYQKMLMGYRELAEKGYTVRADVLPPPAFDMRGFDESFFDSSINAFKRQLQTLKVIP
jgi:hypothetical protein